jgi:hypothetical protein
MDADLVRVAVGAVLAERRALVRGGIMDAILTDPGAGGLLHGVLLVLAAAGGFLLGAAGFAAGWCLARRAGA